MMTERLHRKLELAADREAEKLARAEDKKQRASRNHEVACRQIDEARRRITYFRNQSEALAAAERAGEQCP